MSLNNKLIYSRSISGKALQWRAYTDYKLNSNGHITITIEFGQVDGKLQIKERHVRSGKNIGKANETSIKEQADLEIKYLYQKQYDKAYFDSLDDFEVPLRPQLAHKYKDKAHKVHWLVTLLGNHHVAYYASKKLNGIRCFIFLVDGEVYKFESRTGKCFKFFSHIAEELIQQLPDDKKEGTYIFDGELFNPLIPFEILCSLINSDEYVEVTDAETGTVWSTNDVQFHCYDHIDLKDKQATFYKRFIENPPLVNTKSIKLVENILVNSEEEVVTQAKLWIAEGFEGLMLRFAGGIYEFGQRTVNLLKFKIMEQEEFLIKKIYLAENDSSKVMFTLFNNHCISDDYTEFDCALKGDKNINLEIYNKKELHENNSWLTVDYQVKSKYGVPLFPVGIVIRQGSLIDGVFVPSQ